MQARPLVLVLALATAPWMAGCFEGQGIDPAPSTGPASDGGPEPGGTGEDQGDGGPRVERDFHVITVWGNVTQSPSTEGQPFACGAVVGPRAALEFTTRQLQIEASSTRPADFDWQRSWLVTGEDVETHGDASQCHVRYISSHEGNYSIGHHRVPVTQDGSGLRVGDQAMAEGASVTLHVDSSDGQYRYVGDIKVTYRGAWNTTRVSFVEGPLQGWTALWG